MTTTLTEFFKDLELGDPDVYINAVGDNLGQTMGLLQNRPTKKDE